MGVDGAWQAINFTRDGSSEVRRGGELEQLAVNKVLGSNQSGCRSVDGGGLGATCMKASGEGAGTKAGLGVEESRADETQGRRTTRKKCLTLPVLTRYLCVQAVVKRVRVILMRARERVLLAYEVCVGEKLIYFDFFAAYSIDALMSIFDISSPSRCHI